MINLCGWLVAVQILKLISRRFSRANWRHLNVFFLFTAISLKWDWLCLLMNIFCKLIFHNSLKLTNSCKAPLCSWVVCWKWRASEVRAKYEWDTTEVRKNTSKVRVIHEQGTNAVQAWYEQCSEKVRVRNERSTSEIRVQHEQGTSKTRARYECGTSVVRMFCKGTSKERAR